jgi:flagellar motility protein MotE (MotC chaperone)
MSWKDQYRERKEDSGLTWDEFVEQRLHHADELDDLRQDVQALDSDIAQLTTALKRLYRELHEHNVLDGERE